MKFSMFTGDSFQLDRYGFSFTIQKIFANAGRGDGHEKQNILLWSQN